MNALARLYPGDDAVRLALSVAVQIAGIVLAALIASWIIARRHAALCDAIWKAALALVCLAPLAALSFQRAGVALWHVGDGLRAAARESEEPVFGGVPGTPQRAFPTVASAREIPPRPLPAAQPSTPTRSVSEDAPASASKAAREPAQHHPKTLEAVVGALIGIWAIGVALLVARLLVGLRIVARLRHGFEPFVNLPPEITDRLRRTLTVQSLPRIMVSRRIGAPASIGLWRPIVVLPADLTAKMSADELHDALAHECTHALRHDAVIALVQQIVAALYWLHPFIPILNRQLCRAREEVCDNVVLAGTTATDYARTLLSLAQTVQSTRGRIAIVPMFDPRWRLAARVAGLLNTRRIVMTRMTKRALALVAATSLTLGATLAAISAAGDQPKDAKSDPKPSEITARPEKAANADRLQRFLEERVKLADEAYRLLQASYEAGTMTLDPLMAASDDLTDAMLAMSKTKAERIAIREKQVERANDLEAKLKALNKVNARGGEADKVARVGANRIRAEIALERERRDAPAATEPDALPTNAAKSVDGEKGTEALAPKGVFSKLATDDWHLADDDANLRKALQEARFDERKAELDVREAVALLGVKNYTYEKVVDANEKVPGAVPIKEIKLDKAEADVAAIHVEQAKLFLERARATIERISPHVYIAYSPETWIATNLHDAKGRSNPRSLTGYGGANEHPDLAFGEMTVKSALAGYLLQPRDLGPARVAVVRYKGTLCKTLAAADELKPTDGVLVRDLVAGKAKNEIVHHGDFIILFGGRFWAETPAAAKDESTSAPK